MYVPLDGKTPLILAIEHSLESVAILLLDKGADANIADHRFMMPLHHAVVMLSKAVTERLLTVPSVDVEAHSEYSPDGDAPLMICSRVERLPRSTSHRFCCRTWRI